MLLGTKIMFTRPNVSDVEQSISAVNQDWTYTDRSSDNTEITVTAVRLLRDPLFDHYSKKRDLEKSELKNFRPVSNLAFLSKIVEKAVSVRLKNHLTRCDLVDKNQSAYREDHNTETILILKLSDRLQKIQNTSAHIIYRLLKLYHIKPVLKELHWLPIKTRIEHKIQFLTYKAKHGLAPQYLSNMLSSYSSSRNLRPNSQDMPNVPRCRLKTFGQRSFTHAAPTLWNSLPYNLKTINNFDLFKSKLKTNFSQQYFP
ncbi:uncharacterized protein [Haliotis asinina]|uniref:uncharacterized protein n=1 Tax=Haliotis asinina TaxID=109174 RepID=UPI003531DFF0